MSDCTYTRVTFFSGEYVPLEMHKARMVQRVHLIPARDRLEVLTRTGNNTFLLPNRDVFLDMLTDSGVNAMSEAQYAAMLMADDSYAGSETFYRLEKTIQDFFGLRYFLPAHQGRACENILASTYVSPETPTVVTNYHFTTTKAHILLRGGRIVEAISDAGLETVSDLPFKGDYDLDKFDALVKESGGPSKIAFVRIEAGTNLIGGQPVSLDNMRKVSAYCRKNGLRLVYDASLLADNLFFIKTREKECQNRPLDSLVREIASLMDIIYFSGRKLGCARGGGICTDSKAEYMILRDLVPLYEGFLTYGGMSVREMEAMAVGIRETLDIHNISQTPLFVEALGLELEAKNVPVVTPYGGLGCHVDASRFIPHVPQEQYPAAALGSAIYLVSGVRGMERGTLSESRNPDGSEHLSNMELVRLAVPKRVFTHSQIKYAADRIGWLHRHRDMIGGLTFEDEPKTLRFFLGRLKAIGDWQERLVAKYLEDMPSGL
ncbi:MAG: tryptophanase [Deltaproteobacteria bacterium]|jgi:tryptophanase|nr:tryptophanase [Deltaproteobacteria bacterium]